MLKLRLEPFKASEMCPACAYHVQGDAPAYRYCEGECVPLGAGFTDVGVVGSSPNPHLHRQCGRCRFEWLTEIWDGKNTLTGELLRTNPRTAKAGMAKGDEDVTDLTGRFRPAAPTDTGGVTKKGL